MKMRLRAEVAFVSIVLIGAVALTIRDIRRQSTTSNEAFFDRTYLPAKVDLGLSRDLSTAYDFDIKAGRLYRVMVEILSGTGMSVAGYSCLLDKPVGPLKGRYTPAEALAKVLAAAGYRYVLIKRQVVVQSPPEGCPEPFSD